MTSLTSLDTTTRTTQPPAINSYMDKTAVAALFDVSTRTVDRLMASGDLSFTRVRGQVRFSLHDVVRFLAKNEVSSIA